MTATITQGLKAAGIRPVVLHKVLPCQGGWLWANVTADEGIEIAVVPNGDGTWTAEFDSCNETRECLTIREARVWLSVLNYGGTRSQADECAELVR